MTLVSSLACNLPMLEGDDTAQGDTDADADADSGTPAGYPGACPASAPMRIELFHDDPWAPATAADAYQQIVLADTPPDGHYSRLETRGSSSSWESR